MKKIISIFMALFTLASFSVCINAAVIPETEILPLWENTSSVTNSIGFSGTQGTVSCTVHGDAGTTVTGEVRVYRQTASGAWSFVGMDSGSSETRLLNLVVDFTAKSGAYYKSVLTATVYKNGVGEEVTRTSYKTCP